jgi:choline dehydrogenase-like flavoprotein
MAGRRVTRDFDAVVIGSGPGGSTVADALCAAGWSVLVIEKGRNHLLDLSDPSRLLDRFSNDELKFTTRHFLGPDPLVEPRTFRRSEDDGEHGHVGEVNSVPSTVGGGGVHADGKLPRFREEDFALRSSRGPIDGAAVEDWPVSYAELEPFYTEVENAIGVAGDAGANPFASPRSGPYPMPPGPPMYASTLTIAAAERFGLHPYPAPTGANSVPFAGRPACNNCGFCSYYGCPIHAKGDPVAMLQRALLSGRCEIRPETFARRVVVRDGRATGVDLVGVDGTPSHVAARWVVVAGGAVETPRLLLLSGMTHPALGRHVMFHFQTFVMGFFADRLHAHRGRAVTHVHDDHVVDDGPMRAAARDAGLPWFRGGMVEHCGPAHPVQEAKLTPPGGAHKDMMRASLLRERMWGFCMQGEDLSVAANRIDLDPTVRDARGVPVARVTYTPHHHEQVASRHYAAMLQRVVAAAGAEWSVIATSPDPDAGYGRPDISPVPMSRHVMGTARMGADPASSVVDQFGRVHGVANLVVADSSVFVTSAGYGPTLTLTALALRAARAMAEEGR